jgi:hypothetical protein
MSSGKFITRLKLASRNWPHRIEKYSRADGLYRIVLPWEKSIESTQAARVVGVQARRKSLLTWATAAFFVLAVIGGLVCGES